MQYKIIMYIIILSIVLLIIWFYKPFRFYVFSYVFSQLYDRPRLSSILGIKYVDVMTWKTNRTESRIYSYGVFVKILKLITGMDLRVSNDVIKRLHQLQSEHSKQIDMNRYFDQIADKQLSLQQFEYFLSYALLIETNRIYQVYNNDELQILLDHSPVIFDVLNALSGGMVEGIISLIHNIRSLMVVSRVLKKAPEPERLMIFGPQLSLVTNFTKMIWRQKGDLKNIQPNDFLNLLTKFFVFESNGHLVFVSRSTRDISNSPNNKAFGPSGVVCPGARLTMDYIKSILSFLQNFDIEFIGEARFEGNRFKNIVNKSSVSVIFKPIINGS